MPAGVRGHILPGLNEGLSTHLCSSSFTNIYVHSFEFLNLVFNFSINSLRLIQDKE